MGLGVKLGLGIGLVVRAGLGLGAKLGLGVGLGSGRGVGSEMTLTIQGITQYFIFPLAHLSTDITIQTGLPNMGICCLLNSYKNN